MDSFSLYFWKERLCKEFLTVMNTTAQFIYLIS